jgi:hypothetical protein
VSTRVLPCTHACKRTRMRALTDIYARPNAHTDAHSYVYMNRCQCLVRVGQTFAQAGTEEFTVDSCGFCVHYSGADKGQFRGEYKKNVMSNELHANTAGLGTDTRVSPPRRAVMLPP